MSPSETIAIPLADVVAPVTAAAEAKARDLGRPCLATVGVPCAFDDPLALLSSTAPDTAGWWAGPGIRVAGADVASYTEASGVDRFSSLATTVERWFEAHVFDGRAPIAFMGGAYTDQRPSEGWDGFGAAVAWLPELCAIRDEEGTWLVAATLVFEGDAARAADHLVTVLARGADDVVRPMGDIVIHPPAEANGSLTPDDAGWAAGVADALADIESGPLEKVVLAQRRRRADLPEGADPWLVAAKMSAAYPECYAYGARFEGRTFVGATPELLVAREGTIVRSAPTAGTVPRGDQGLASIKARHEHQLVADAVRETLGAFTTSLEVASPVETAAGPMEHLTTTIAGTLAEPTHIAELVSALHPTPAVGGVPVAEALDLQQRREGFDRGWYAGPIGVVEPSGDGCVAIALRGALLHPDGIDVFAGAGIVAGSDADAERDEIALKMSAAEAALR